MQRISEGRPINQSKFNRFSLFRLKFLEVVGNNLFSILPVKTLVSSFFQLEKCFIRTNVIRITLGEIR